MTIHFLSRRLSPLACLSVVVLMSLPSVALSQVKGHGKGNARVMDLSLQFDESANKVACLGTPNELHVAPGDILVLRAQETFVNDVTWDSTVVRFNGNGKPSLANNPNIRNTGSFSRGAAFAFVVNASIRDTTAYELKAVCGDIDDNPPKIIVDP